MAENQWTHDGRKLTPQIAWQGTDTQSTRSRLSQGTHKPLGGSSNLVLALQSETDQVSSPIEKKA